DDRVGRGLPGRSGRAACDARLARRACAGRPATARGGGMTVNVSLIGGEMQNWSDHGPDERPAVGGAVLTHLLGLLAPLVPADGQVLVAGPHDAPLRDALA